MYSARFGRPNYAECLRDTIKSIVHTLINDLKNSLRNDDYITDSTASSMKNIIRGLSCSGFSLSCDSEIDSLAWFVGGDPSKIRQMQSRLNALGPRMHLNEDGVYGKKTLAVWLDFLNRLEHGQVPTLCWIDVLQSEHTGISVGHTKNGGQSGLNNAFVQNKHPYIRFDPPHPGQTAFFRGEKRKIDYNHVNFDKMPDSNWLYDQIREQFNHYPLTDEAYNVLKDLKESGKIVRIAGKTLLVAGIALDALELGMAIDADLKDADRKLGKTTSSTLFSIVGRWGGAIAGAKGGAMLGALTGPAAPVAIPILSIAGGIAGSFFGDWGGNILGEKVVDITKAED